MPKPKYMCFKDDDMIIPCFLDRRDILDEVELGICCSLIREEKVKVPSDCPYYDEFITERQKKTIDKEEDDYIWGSKSNRNQEIFTLREQGYSFPEIAKKLGIEHYRIVSRAYYRLCERLEKTETD